MSQTNFADITGSAARLSPCGTYRYTLTRAWNPAGPRMLFVMLNPSTADANQDDPTIRRCLGFARRESAGALEVVNLFAYRATDPRALLAAEDPVGPDNNAEIRAASRRAAIIVAAWGSMPAQSKKLAGRVAEVFFLGLLGPRDRIMCLGTAKKTGAATPAHPLYLPGVAPLRPLPAL